MYGRITVSDLVVVFFFNFNICFCTFVCLFGCFFVVVVVVVFVSRNEESQMLSLR